MDADIIPTENGRCGMNEERNRRIYRFLRDYVNFGDETINEDVLVAAVGLLIRENVFTFKELQFECAMKVRAIIPNDWQEGAFV